MAHATQTPTPNSMVILGGKNEDTDYKPKRVSSGRKQKLKTETSPPSLEILPPEDKENDRRQGTSKKSSRPNSGRPGSGSRPGSSGSRPGSSATRAPPVRDSPTRRPATPNTPSRQISLQTVKRKEEKELDFGPLDWKTTTDISSQHLPGQVDRLTLEDSSPQQKEAGGVLKGKRVETLDISDSDEFDTDLEEDDNEEAREEQEENPKAPMELMLEFLETVYKKEWKVAGKLCKMILIYEPENAEANKFAPLIEEKLQLDAEASSDEESGDSDDSDSDEESDESDIDNSRRKRRKKRAKSSIKMKCSQESTDEDYNAEDEAESTDVTTKDSGIGLVSHNKTDPS